METTNLELSNKILLLEKKLLIIELKLDQIIFNTKRLDDHISFIEIIYSKVKSPFNYIISKFNRNSSFHAIL